MEVITKETLRIIDLAIQEDIGAGDVTASLIEDDHLVKAHVVCNQAAILSGIPVFDEVFKKIDMDIRVQWHFEDGDSVQPKTVICNIEGSAKNILTAERAALNFLQTLSATATTTAKYVKLLTNTRTKILDTRKTIPGLRALQKYAVRCGGGSNHRMGLYDRVLIKENHIIACGSIAKAVSKAKQNYPELLVECEVENNNELKQAISAKADIIMLDNFSIHEIHKAVTLNNGQVTLEASGNVDRHTLATLAQTGVDYISSGALTKNIQAIDFSLRFDA